MAMNNLDVAGVLRTYSEKAAKATSTNQLREIVPRRRVTHAPTLYFDTLR